MKIYKSKVSFVLLIIIFVVLFGVFFKAFQALQIIPILICVILNILILFLFFNTKYTISQTNLNVNASFLVNKNIDIMTINKITSSKSILSAPAASLDRLEIFYNSFDSVLISPKFKQQFVNDLIKINPAIEVKL